MPRLEHGTSLILPAGTRAQITASVPLEDVTLVEQTPAVLVVAEDFGGTIRQQMMFLRGAYVKTTRASGAVPAGTDLFLAPGTTVDVPGKLVGPVGGEQVCAPCGSSPLQTVGLMFVAVVLGGLLLNAMLKE